MTRQLSYALAFVLLALCALPEPIAAQGFDGSRQIEKVRFRGNRKVEDDAIRVNLLTKPGGTLDLAKVREDIRAVWKMGFFADVRVEAEITPTGGLIVVFAVTEKPSVRRVWVSGNEELDLDKINEELDLKTDSILNVPKVKQNQEKIRELYVREGFYLASVDYELRPVNESEVDVWYFVRENAKVEVREVSFIGNKAFSDDELKSLMATQTAGPLSSVSGSGVYREDAFERDLLILSAHYFNNGYVQVKLGTPQVRLSRDKRYMYLSIPIDEGPVFTIGSIDFTGDLIGPKEDYFERLTLEKGEIFNRSKIGADLVALNDYYGDKGYAYVNIQPQTPLNIEKRTVDLAFDVEKGKKVYFERINISGNSKTRDKVIRREMKVAEGDLYSQTNLDISRRRVEALGYFEKVEVSTRRGSSDELMIVNVEISERPTGTFQIGAGFSSVESFIAQAQISQNNLFGRGQTLSLQAQLSNLRQIFTIRFVEPYFLDTRWTFAFDLFNQNRSINLFSREAKGGSLTWGYPISFETRAFLTYKLEEVRVATGGTGFSNFGSSTQVPIASGSVANLFRGGITSSVQASLSYDSRNNRLFPTAGWYHRGFVEVAESALGSQNVFIRYGAFSRQYWNIFKKVVFVTNAEFGVVTSRNPLGVPIVERFLLGGITDVRGFTPRSLGPQLRVSQVGDTGQPLGEQILGGNLKLVWNSELQFPLFEQVQISGVLFFDAGNAYNLEDRYCTGAGRANVSPKVDPCFDFPRSITKGLRSSVGFGFRWFSPIGPLRFEWGLPLDRQPNERPLVFEFTIGSFL